MPRKYKLEEVISLSAERGIKVLDKVYCGSHVPLRCICVCGHPMEKSFGNILRGQLCKSCGYARRDVGKFSYEYVSEYFKEQGCVLLEVEYKSIDTLMEYVCSCGNVSKIAFDRFKKGQRCRKCYLERNVGKKHPRYKPELTDEYRMSKRNNLQLRQWYHDIKVRDNFTCLVCGDSRGGNLNSHHLYSYATYPEKRLDLDNGITLCKTCHLDFHGRYGYGNNTAGQFKSYLQDIGKSEVVACWF